MWAALKHLLLHVDLDELYREALGMYANEGKVRGAGALWAVFRHLMLHVHLAKLYREALETCECGSGWWECLRGGYGCEETRGAERLECGGGWWECLRGRVRGAKKQEGAERLECGGAVPGAVCPGVGGGEGAVSGALKCVDGEGWNMLVWNMVA
eukprot:365905-Chlamydomonas_euryale.AAC.4